jgi:hypothetical protein
MGIPAASGVAAAGKPNLGDQANAVLSGQITGVGPTPAFALRGPMNLALWASIIATLTTTAGSLAATVNSATGLAAGDAINSVNVPHGATIGGLAGTAVTLALQNHTYYGNISVAGVSPARISGLISTDRILGSTVTVPSNNEGVTLPAGTTVTAILQAAVAPTNTSPGTPGIVQLSAPPTVSPATTAQIAFQFALTGNGVTATGADAAASFTGAAVSYSGTLQLERSFDGGFTWIVCNIGSAGALAQWTAGTPVSLTFGEPEKNVLYRINCTAYSSGTINYRISQTGGAAESLAIGPLSGG